MPSPFDNPLRPKPQLTMKLAEVVLAGREMLKAELRMGNVDKAAAASRLEIALGDREVAEWVRQLQEQRLV